MPAIRNQCCWVLSDKTRCSNLISGTVQYLCEEHLKNISEDVHGNKYHFESFGDFVKFNKICNAKHT